MRDLTQDYRFQRILIEAAQFRTLRAAYRADPSGPVTTALFRETFSAHRDDPAILRDIVGK